MAVACGIPAVTLTFDLRVQEIYEFWRLPFTTVEEARNTSARKLYEKADFAPFNARMPMIYETFRQYLEANGVSHAMTARASSTLVTAAGGKGANAPGATPNPAPRRTEGNAG
jgi:hypothetical protein